MKFLYILFPIFLITFLLPRAGQAQRIVNDGGDIIFVDGPVVVDGEEEEAAEDKDAKNEEEEDDLPKGPLAEQVSRHIQKLADEERKKRMDFMEVVIDDVARLSGLESAQRETLILAAKGATERSMKRWHEQAERYFRSRLKGADEDSAKEILENMGNINFGGRDAEKEGESTDLWKETLSDVLTEEQVAKYEEVIEQRHQDRVDAFAAISISSLDGHLRLTPEQKEKMSGLIQTAAAEHLVEVQRYWGDYFERGMLMSVANAAEEEELKEILTEAQLKRLKTSTSSFDHFWDQKKRLKKAKEKAARLKKEKEAKEGSGEEGEDAAESKEKDENAKLGTVGQENDLLHDGPVINVDF